MRAHLRGPNNLLSLHQIINKRSDYLQSAVNSQKALKWLFTVDCHFNFNVFLAIDSQL